jgi:uncharacterized protein DUF1579
MEETATQATPKMQAEPEKEHQWLQQLVGEWTMEGEAIMGPDQPPQKFEGTESVRPVGGLWILGEGKGQVPDGTPSTSIMTLGYDSQKKRFVGTFITSMMSHLWIYDDGELDEAARKLTLNAEGPGMSGDGSMAKYKDVIELKSDDHRVLSSHYLGDDGNWHHFMTAHYRRTK